MAIGTAGSSWQAEVAKRGIRCILAGLASLLFFAPQASAAECPNEALRTGLSSLLPACRSYELVSPRDASGRLLRPINTFNVPALSSEIFPTELASPAGDSIIFMTYQSPLPEVRGAVGVGDIYEARRGAEGWSTEARVGPSGYQTTGQHPGGVASDHSYATAVVGPRGPLGVEGLETAYLFGRDGSAELPGIGDLGVEPWAHIQYITDRGSHIIFSTGHDFAQSDRCFQVGNICKVLQLEPDAPPTGTGAIYDRSVGGSTHVVSLLPGEIPLAGGEKVFYKGTSKDASTVAFEINGSLYVRIHNGAEAEEATLKVAEGAPVFGGISDEGRYVFYIPGGEKGTIHRFDTATEADVEVNTTAAGELVNISGDGSHVYFIAEEPINGEGVAGEPNLFVWKGVAPELVATVAPSDLDQTSIPRGSGVKVPALTRWTGWIANHYGDIEGRGGPGADSSRTTPDGTVLVFESRAQLTSYDNTEATADSCGDPEEGGEGCTEIYRYDDEAKDLVCVSCAFGQPARHDARLQELFWTTVHTVVHNVSDDGSQVFFETEEPLVGRDDDGVNDIYEWREGPEEERSVGLISSGQSPTFPERTLLNQSFQFLPPPNVLIGATPSGNDVVFLSREVLVEGAPEGGGTAIYDARVGGGFPPRLAPKICAEEECKPTVRGGSSPAAAGLLSEALQGGGNVRARNRRHAHKHHRRCRDRHGRHKRRCADRSSARSGGVVSGGSSSTGEAETVGEPTAIASPLPSAPRQSAVGPTSEFGSEYGIEAVSTHLSDPQAGARPDVSTDIVLNHRIVKGHAQADETTEEVSVALPPGVLGRATAVNQCKTAEFLTEHCPLDSQVGIAKVTLTNFGKLEGEFPIFNLTPPLPNEEIARLGFFPLGAAPVYIDVKVRTAGDYGVTGTAYGTSGLGILVAAETILWGDPSNASHDLERLPEKLCGNEVFMSQHPDLSCEVARTNLAFMTNPSACQEGSVGFAARSYQLPGQLFTASAPMAPIADCTGLPFTPSLEAAPTSHVAGAPTGLKTRLVLPQHLKASERATATMREARVTLPAGMQVAAGAANWIGTCSDQQVGFHEEVDTACPDSSKLGTATIKSPALTTPIEGTIYQRSPTPGHQLGLWLTSDALGMHIKLPGELEPDKQTGRLTAVFRDLPQVPVEEIDLNVWGGPRAPLQNPDHCGTFTTNFSFSPHSDDPAATGQSQMQITEGCNQGFSPTLRAGVTEPKAGKFSPFVFDLTRPDGDQAMRGFELKLPEGELAKIKGVPLCSDADAAAASCPGGSRIGSIQATTGPGPEPFTIPAPGKAQPQIYLSGPYQGSAFSIVSEVPAQAGPFDLGVLAVRSGLTVEPETGIAVVKADPLPQFFEGVGIAYRHLHAVVDRPEFNLNPTDCRELAVTANVASTLGTVVHPSARFQVDGCKALKFKPKLTLKLKGGTKRAQYPALSATLKARRGDANIAYTSVALPHSEFLAQEHIGTICTRKQFAADKCPKGSVYGSAKAFTPLLDKPLSGPVYLRSSNHPLPDLVAKLDGQLEIDLVGRIDSVHGGIRTTFESVPDAPVSKFVLHMKGGAKSLLTNSTDICRGSHKATVAMKAQNGRKVDLRPVLQSSGCGEKKLGQHHKHH